MAPSGHCGTSRGRAPYLDWKPSPPYRSAVDARRGRPREPRHVHRGDPKAHEEAWVAHARDGTHRHRRSAADRGSSWAWALLMHVNGRIVAAVANATSTDGALNAVTGVIAEALKADACIIFVGGTKKGLEPRAHFGKEIDPAVTAHARALGE